jgi:hypothetical protein
MSKSTWSMVVSASFTFAAVFLPNIPNRLRLLLFGISCLFLLVSCIGWVIAHAASLWRLRMGRLPGLSLHILLRLNNLPVSRRKYLFDFGKLEAERLSIYVSPDHIFTLSFVDAKSEPHLLQVSLGPKGFPIGIFVYLLCEVGVSGESTLLHMRVNRREVGSLLLRFRTDIGVLDVPNGVIGADLAGNNGAAFDLSELAVYSMTIATSDRNKLSRYFTNQKLDKYVQFNGAQWMRISESPAQMKVPKR